MLRHLLLFLLFSFYALANIPPQVTYDPNGNNTTTTFTYDAVGNMLTKTINGTSENSFLFTGEQLDKETDEYYLRARYYSPSMSRFLNRDTYDGKLIDPLSQNHYLYAGGNPVMYVDPSGHFFAGLSMISFLSSTLWEGFMATKGTIETGAIVAMQAKTLIVGLNLRQEALDSIYIAFMEGNKESLEAAYKKYDYAVKYIQLTTGNAYEVYKAYGWVSATRDFAFAWRKLPALKHSVVLDRYIAKTNSLNHMITLGLDKVVKDKMSYDEILDTVHGMTKFLYKIGNEIGKRF